MQTALKLPYAGHRSWVGGQNSQVHVDSNGYYWSSSPDRRKGHYMKFHSHDIKFDLGEVRASGLSVRCFKN